MICVAEVPVRELNQNTAGVLARVKRGELIDITERGAVIARLVPAHQDPLSDLMATGKLHPATITGRAPRAPGPVQTDDEAGELLRELRDAERY
jgi:prevent-host-death family protein